jgi:DNA-binding XRE family transcriptional regulator
MARLEGCGTVGFTHNGKDGTVSTTMIGLTDCPRCGWSADAMKVIQAARYVGVTNQTIRNWIKGGLLPGAVTEHYRDMPDDGDGGDKWWVPKADLDALRDRVRAEADDAAIAKELGISRGTIEKIRATL